MPTVPCWQVDAFADRPFTGNPAAVCWLENEAPATWMQSVAAEMNLAETAFARRIAEGIELRWFTPTVEVDLCGHATLATAYALWQAGLAPQNEPLRFSTKSGLLTCTQDGHFIEMDFPATLPLPAEPPTLLLEGLGVTPTFVGRSRFDYLAVLSSAGEVRSLQPDLNRLKQLPVRGVIVTALSDDPQFDFVSRFFAPATGIDEDPVCGSAHCCLTPYWAGRLDKAELLAYQASSRGGVLRLRLRNDRVLLGGQAVLIFSGQLHT